MTKDRLRNTHILLSGETSKQLQEIAHWSHSPSTVSTSIRQIVRRYYEMLSMQVHNGYTVELIPAPLADGSQQCPKIVDLKI